MSSTAQKKSSPGAAAGYTPEAKNSSIRNFFTGIENRYLFILLFSVLILRVVSITMIGEGGRDAVEEFFTAKQILLGLPFDIIHRTARFASEIPQTLAMAVFGTGALSYYIAPILASLISVLFLYKTAFILKGRNFAIITASLFAVFPQAMVDGVHPRASTFSIMYFLVALYVIIRFFEGCGRDSEARQRVRLITAAVFIFLVYMSKEDGLYFLPVLFLFIWDARRKFSDVMIFGTFLFGLYLSETLIYFLFTDFTLGRLSVIKKGHLDSIMLLPITSYWHVFDRYLPSRIGLHYLITILTAIAGGIYLLIAERSKRSVMKYIVYLAAIYLALMTFLVKGLHPIVPINTFQARYLNITIPLLILVITYSVFTIIEKKRGAVSSGRSAFVMTAAAIVMISSGLAANYAGSKKMDPQHNGLFKNYPPAVLHDYKLLFRKALENGDPVFSYHVADGVRFIPITEQIEAWQKEGMTLADACARYKVSVAMYNEYKSSEKDTRLYGEWMSECTILDDDLVKAGTVKAATRTIKGTAVSLVYIDGKTDPDTLFRKITANPEAQYLMVVDKPLRFVLTTPRQVIEKTHNISRSK